MVHDLRRLGWGDAGRAAGRAGYLLDACTVQGSAGGCKERDEDARMLMAMVTSTRLLVADREQV